MTLPDVRGCWNCKESVVGKLPQCPHCGAPLILSFTIDDEPLDCPVLTEPADED